MRRFIEKNEDERKMHLESIIKNEKALRALKLSNMFEHDWLEKKNCFKVITKLDDLQNRRIVEICGTNRQ